MKKKESIVKQSWHHVFKEAKKYAEPLEPRIDKDDS